MTSSSSKLIPEISLANSTALQASKWISLSLLCDEAELKNLFESLGEFFLVSIAGVNEAGKEITSLENFLSDYRTYIEALKQGTLPSSAFIQEALTKGLSSSLDHFGKIVLGDGRSIVRIVKPVIQIQASFFIYSQTDGKFHEKAFSQDSIPWGLQFSYPQLFQEVETKEIKKVLSDSTFPNTLLFKKLQEWVRNHTTPTPFLIGEKKINLSARIGKSQKSWLNQHPSLLNKGLRVIA